MIDSDYVYIERIVIFGFDKDNIPCTPYLDYIFGSFCYTTSVINLDSYAVKKIYFLYSLPHRGGKHIGAITYA